MIVISGELLNAFSKSGHKVDVLFKGWDQEDVFNLFHHVQTARNTPGSIHFTESMADFSVSKIGKATDRIRVVVIKKRNENTPGFSEIKGYLLQESQWKEVPVKIIPVKEELFSRSAGILETDKLANKSVFIIGNGSGGSIIGTELAKAGVGIFYLMDHDRFEIPNSSRHIAGISHVGRYKTKVEENFIHEINPYAKVWTFEEKACWETVEKVREIVKKVNIVVDATDNRPSRLVTNRVIVEEGKPCIFAGAFRRAHGGQVLFVKPHTTLCYQCFCMPLPEQTNDQEISRTEQAESLAYAYGPGPIEPGLSTDIAPISNMVVKLVIQHLLKGSETTLRSLDDDLVAPWLIWLNRREVGSQYENLEPLEFNIDGFHVLRWYGIKAERHPGCPVCGDFEEYILRQKSIGKVNSK